MVHSAKYREYQLVAKSTVPCFRVIFTMSIFSLWYMPPLCLSIGGTTLFFLGGGRHTKKFLAQEFVPPTSKPCRRLWWRSTRRRSGNVRRWSLLTNGWERLWKSTKWGMAKASCPGKTGYGFASATSSTSGVDSRPLAFVIHFIAFQRFLATLWQWSSVDCNFSRGELKALKFTC